MDLKKELKAGDEIPLQIAPYGEYPATSVEGEKVVQRFTLEAFLKVVDDWTRNGKPNIRADFDHESEAEAGSTIASGWITNLSVDPEKGLVGTLVVSDAGAGALNGLDYRYGSPVFILEEDGTPAHLESFALTNRPRLKELAAVWNSETPAPAKPLNSEEPAAPSEQEAGQPKQTKNESTPMLEEIKLILGLPAESTEDDVKAKVTELVETVKKAADEEIREEAEEVVNECGLVPDEKKEEVVNSYAQNPQLVKAVLNALRKPEAHLVANAAEAVKPKLADAEKMKAEYAKMKGGQARVDWLRSHPGATV